MKGKICYISVINQEVEIPDELIELTKKNYNSSLTKEEDKKREELSEFVWKEIHPDCRCGMYCGDLVIEEY